MQQEVVTWWHELNTWDALEARNFYRRTLGWTFEQVTLPDGEPYWLARKGGKTRGGVFSLSAPAVNGIPAHWMTDMAVDDLERAARESASAGGEVTSLSFFFFGFGLFCFVSVAFVAVICFFVSALVLLVFFCSINVLSVDFFFIDVDVSIFF